MHIFTWLKQHRLGIIVAVLVGIICASPQVISRLELGSAYRGIMLTASDDDGTYIARMREILDGHPSVSSPYYFEYKSESPLVWPVGEYFYAIPSIVFHLSLLDTALIAKGILPAVLFFLVYFMILQLTKTRFGGPGSWVALSGGLLVTLGYDFSVLSVLGSWSRGLSPDVQFSIWTRPVNPITGAILIFSCLILCWKMVEDKWKFVFLPIGIMMAASVYYFFIWSILLSFFVFLLLGCILRKDWLSLKRILLCLLVFVVVSAPYWFGQLKTLVGVEGLMLAKRNGLLLMHTPLLNKTLLIAFVLFVLSTVFMIRFQKRFAIYKEGWWVYCLSLLLGGLWALNQQVITGRAIWPYHFVQYTKPFVYVALMVTLYYVFSARFRKLLIFICLITSIASIANGLAEATTVVTAQGSYESNKKFAAVFDWLNLNSSKDCVVLDLSHGGAISIQIPVYTQCNTYSTSWNYSGVPRERILHNFFILMRLKGVTDITVRDYLINHPSEVRSYFFEDWRTMFNRGLDDWVIGIINDLVPKYIEFNQMPLAQELRKYRVDYIITDFELTPQECKHIEINCQNTSVSGWFVYSVSSTAFSI
jgi:cell division protein FtsL